MTPSTYFGLLAEFNAAHVPITQIAAKYFGHDDKTAKSYAAKNKYPFPLLKIGTQRMVDIIIFAEYLDKLKAKSVEEYRLAR